jgi:acyl-CoA dehydrogenase
VVIHGAQATSSWCRHAPAAPSRTATASLYLVDTKGAGVSVKDYRTIDNLRAADVPPMRRPR